MIHMAKSIRMVKTIRDIIAAAGGEQAIVDASEATSRSIGRDAVRKWAKKFGIPAWHWPLVMRLSGATESEMLAANEALKVRPRKPGPPQRRRRSPKRRALAQVSA